MGTQNNGPRIDPPGKGAGETFGVIYFNRSSQGARRAATEMRSKVQSSAQERGIEGFALGADGLLN
jgi:hypothetical protein